MRSTQVAAFGVTQRRIAPEAATYEDAFAPIVKQTLAAEHWS